MAIEMTFTEHLPKGPDEVFALLADPEGYGRWMPNLLEVKRLDEGEVKVGTRFLETRKVMGMKSTEHFEFTELSPGQTVELLVDGTKGTSKKGRFRFRYELKPDGNGTVMTVNGSVEGLSKFSELLGKLFAGGMKKAIAKDHGALRDYLAQQ